MFEEGDVSLRASEGAGRQLHHLLFEFEDLKFDFEMIEHSSSH
jgi:hypothetical protein